MTPFLRQLYGMASNSPSRQEFRKKAMKQMSETICFEMTEILPLVAQTIDTLNGSVLTRDGKPVVGHGGLLVPPSEFTWFEWMQESDSSGDDFDIQEMGNTVILIQKPEMPKKYRMGAMVHYNEECQELHIDVMSSIDPSVVMTSHVEMYDDETCRICAYRNENDRDEMLTKVGGYIGAHVMAMILIINAPYGIRKEVVPVHKAHAREAARQGYALRPHHYVTLHKTAPPPKYSGHNPDGPAFHKAFHFVRSHLRRFQKGGTTLVKAHWRGDPRLGICPMPDYKVKP